MPARAVAAFPPATQPEPVAPRVGSGAAKLRWRWNGAQLKKRGRRSTPLLFVSHDAARAGSQIYLLDVLRSLAARPEFELFLIVRQGGELLHDFENVAHLLDLDERGTASERSALEVALAEMPEPPGLAICNTVVSGAIAVMLEANGIPVISIVHELPTTIDALGEQTIRDTMAASATVIVVSHFVKNALVERYQLNPDQLEVVYVGVAEWSADERSRRAARKEILPRFGISDDASLILGCGSIHHRKGTDLFVQVARRVVEEHGLKNVQFLWAGGDEAGPLFRRWCEHDIATSDLSGYVQFAGPQSNTKPFYLAADAFLLTSREDPFPLVNLEALAAGLPIVAFAAAGGAEEALRDGAGVVVPYLDTDEMARALVRIIEAPRHAASLREKALLASRNRFSRERFIDDLVQIIRRNVSRGTAAAVRGS
jgi:glycosyltransferase involved in cell wall biosynthesis